jgi:iron complex outermembrane receptor protein
VGGSIDVDLKRAGDAPLTEVTTQVSGNGAVGAHLDVSRRFGSNDQFGIRFNQADQGGDSAIDHQRSYNKTSALALDWRGDRVRLTADFLYQNEKIDSGRTTYTATGAIPAAPSATSNYAQPWTYSKLEDTVGILGAEYDFAPGWTAYVKGGLRHTNEHGEYASPAYDGLTGVTASGYRLGTHFQENATSASTGIRGKFDTGPVSHQVSLGASIVSIEQRSAFTFGAGFASNLGDSAAVPYPATYYSGFAGGNESNPGKTEQQINKGISISDTLGFLNDRILFTVGARRQTIGVDTYSSADGSQTSTYSSAITTPILGLVLKPLNNLSVYANRSEALVAGSSAPVTALNYGQVFAPYKSRQWETGVKYDLGNFGANVALFQIEQPTAYTNASTLVYSQSGEQRNRGVEVGFYGQPVKGVRLIAGASYTDGKLTQTDVAANTGNAAVGVPRYLANIGAEYDIPQLAGLTVTGEWVYTSRQFLDAANTLSIGAWSRFDLGARYTTQIYRHPVTVRATVQNVANRAYWASTYGGYLTLGSPRTFLLSLTTDF